MRDEIKSQIRWRRVDKGFSDAGIARYLGIPLDVVRAEIAVIEAPKPVVPLKPREPVIRRVEQQPAPLKVKRAPKIEPQRAAQMQRDGKTLREIGKHFGVSGVAVHKAIAKFYQAQFRARKELV